MKKKIVGIIMAVSLAVVTLITTGCGGEQPRPTMDPNGEDAVATAETLIEEGKYRDAMDVLSIIVLEDGYADRKAEIEKMIEEVKGNLETKAE